MKHQECDVCTVLSLILGCPVMINSSHHKNWSLNTMAQGKFLTHWGRVTHICISKITIIGSDNGLSPGRRQAIIWTNAEILLITPLGTNFSEIIIRVQTFSFKKMELRMSSAKWRHILARPQWVKHVLHVWHCYTNWTFSFFISHQCIVDEADYVSWIQYIQFYIWYQLMKYLPLVLLWNCLWNMTIQFVLRDEKEP